MKNKRIIGIFILLTIQVIFPLYFIQAKERTHEKGKDYTFLIQPVDPYDVFQGKYVQLNTLPIQFQAQSNANWKANDVVFAEFNQQEKGAQLKRISRKKTPFCLKLKIRSVNSKGMITLDLPFHRFYTEEHKAVRIESGLTNDSDGPTFVVARFYRGDFILIDLRKNGKSLIKN